MFLILSFFCNLVLLVYALLQRSKVKELEAGKLSQQHLKETFKSLSLEALKESKDSFLQLAELKMEKWEAQAKGNFEVREKEIEKLVHPIQETFAKVEGHVKELELARLKAYTSLTEQVKHLATSQGKLQSETKKLVDALRVPNVRGRWGEMQLKRVVEMAGMVEHCDFVEQVQSQQFRPDMVIHLPGNKEIVIDSKTPLKAYLEAVESTSEEERLDKMEEHAKQVRQHLVKLGAKSYWEQFQKSPEFVVLFLPAEPFFSAALEHDPELIEYGVEQKVIIATPTTLIALLRSVAYGWRQEQVAKNAQEISELGQTLYERLRVMNDHFGDIKRGLEKSIDSYNKAVGSFESRVLVTGRRFKDLGVKTKQEIAQNEKIDKVPRELLGDE